VDEKYFLFELKKYLSFKSTDKTHSPHGMDEKHFFLEWKMKNTFSAVYWMRDARP
jgi:hypothetical protein